MNRWRKISIVVGIALCVAILVPVIHHYHLRFALASYIAERKAKGEPMDLEQVMPAVVPPGQNGVSYLTGSITKMKHRYFFRTYPPPAMSIVAPGRAMIGWQQPDVRSADGTNTWEELRRELADLKGELDNLQSLTNHPILDFHLDYERELFTQMSNVTTLRWAGDLLNASALYNLHRGKVTDACADIRSLLAMANGQAGEPIQLSQKVRMVLAQIGAAGTWELLQETEISENDLKLLQQDWESLEFIKPVERAYLMERVLASRSLEHYRENPDEGWAWVEHRNALDKMWCQNQWRYFWSYTDEKRALQIYQVLVDATRTAETNHSYKSAKLFTTTDFTRLGLPKPEIRDDFFRMDIDEWEMRWLVSEDAYLSFSLLRRGLATETARDMVITAIALKRYQLLHRQLPSKLQELIPALLTTVPIDWMDGQPLHYRPKAGGTFLLYSVGENGKDDGGNPSPEKGGAHDGGSSYWQNPYALDRVWPQPATPEEIQQYYANQAKKPK
jgi:hypothetical protein